MEAQYDRYVHYFDVRAREIACGVRGIEHRSTKHVRAVTCPVCVSLLARRAQERAEAASASSSLGL